MRKALLILLILNICHVQASDSTQRPTTPPLIQEVKLFYLYENFSKIDSALDKAKESGTLEAVDKGGYTAIHHVIECKTSLRNALLTKLIKAGSKVNARSSNRQQTALHLVVIHRDLEATRILLEAKALVNAQTNTGKTPLHLIIEGLYVEWTGPRGSFYAHKNFQDKIKMAQTLLSAGARTDIPDEEGRLPLAKLKDCKGSSFSTLHALARMGEVKTLRTLADLGMCMHPEKNPGDGITPLHEAQTAEVTKFFLTTGANIHTPDHVGNTPLHTAQNGEVALALLVAGAKINARNHEGNTPLHIAAHGGNIGIARLLLRYTRPPQPRLPEKTKES